jgi:hypothetical protein
MTGPWLTPQERLDYHNLRRKLRYSRAEALASLGRPELIDLGGRIFYHPDTRPAQMLPGRSLSPEHRAKLAEKARARMKTPEERKKISESLRGYKQTEEHKAKRLASYWWGRLGKEAQGEEK